MELSPILTIRFFISVKFYAFKNAVYHYICKCGNLYVLTVHRVSYQAPTGERVKATILDMDLPSSSKYDCYHWLEFRDYLIGAPGKE